MSEKKEKKEKNLGLAGLTGGLVAGGQAAAEIAAEAAIEGKKFSPKKSLATMAVGGAAGYGLAKGLERFGIVDSNGKPIKKEPKK